MFLLYPCSAHKHPRSHWNVFWAQNKESNKGLCLINYIHNDRFDGGLQVREDWSGLRGQWFEQLGKKTVWDPYDPPFEQGPQMKNQSDVFTLSPISDVGLNNYQAQSNWHTKVWAPSSVQQFKWLRSEGIVPKKEYNIYHQTSLKQQQLQNNTTFLSPNNLTLADSLLSFGIMFG